MLETISVHNMISPGLSLEFLNVEHSMNNLLSCCRLVDAKIRASNKDLPVQQAIKYTRERKHDKKGSV